jgi:hypothetical protein
MDTSLTLTKPYKFYSTISMLYITLMIAADVLIYKILKLLKGAL